MKKVMLILGWMKKNRRQSLKQMKHIKGLKNVFFLYVMPTICLVALTSFGLLISVHSLEANPSTVCEFREVEIPPAQGIETPDEKVQRIEKAFYEALNAYDECQTAMSSSSASSASGPSGAVGVASGSAAGTGTASTLDAGETSDQSSPDGGRSSIANLESSPSPSVSTQDLEGGSGEVGGVPPQVPLDNGAVPEDIPPGDDDDIVAQQIREAATSESDPAMRERIWAEYRKYKGLPPK